MQIYPGGVLNVPLPPSIASGMKWRHSFQSYVFPRLMAFKPDFILISAGFDAHESDHLHNSADTSINEFDFYWVTQEL